MEMSRMRGPGSQIGPYQITAVLGEGGMGQVFRARDSRLGRTVAIKVIRAEFADRGDFRHRFQREARAISALNHPHICSLHDIGEQDGCPYLVMEYLEGQTLSDVLRAGPLPLDLAFTYAAQIADALAAAHAQGIVHCDLKPGNIMITSSGAKVLDFGLATRAEASAADAPTATLTAPTREGAVMGTVAYMSPEQAEGKALDARSDMFSFGVLLYEMLCGRRPFAGDTTLSTLASILRESPEHPRKIRPEIPEAAERVVLQCLAKKPESRYASARDASHALESCKPAGLGAGLLHRPLFRLVVAAGLLAVVVLGVLAYRRAARTNWVESVALSQISQSLEKRKPVAALHLVRQATDMAPSSPKLLQLTSHVMGPPISIETDPLGAQVYVRDYGDEEENDLSHWELLGTTPLENMQTPVGLYHYRAVKEGYTTAEGAFVITGSSQTVRIQLPAGAGAPLGMVWIPGVSGGLASMVSYPIAIGQSISDYWLDKYEVTNAQFKDFVDHGGYQNRAYWKQTFIRDGKPVAWEQVMAEFHDATGLRGPATWKLGTYLEGQADYPVSGVSWYEAAAYAEFAGKSLPTAYHWYRASGVGGYSEITTLSNYGSTGPAPVGKRRGLGPFGTYDMAGNVKEWTSSPIADRFYILGGAWNEQPYFFKDQDARRPFDRAANFGFRCAKYLQPLSSELMGPVPFISRDRRNDKPADDQSFAIYKRQHSYDKTDVKATIDETNDSPYWRNEKVSFPAAYGNERVIAHLYLPKNAAAPYQVVMFFPGADALLAQSVSDVQSGVVEFIVRSGRALVLPEYKGMMARGPSEYYHLSGQPGRWMEMNLQWSKDLGRSIDYLETRKDMDTSKLAFYGVSLGAAVGPTLIAVEPRFKTALLFSGGSFEKVPPEVDSWNFAPRVKIPILMLNGRDDFRFPLETSQKPFFKALGTPDKDKRLVLYEGGHDTFTRLEAIKEALDWLDRYLGPVKVQ
jgi:dienelactone hydrolase